MSDIVNTEILEEIAEAIDYANENGSESYVEALERALGANDLEQAVWIFKSHCAMCGQEWTANCNNAECS